MWPVTSRASHRPDVKLVLMSATLNAEQFSQYFGEGDCLGCLWGEWGGWVVVWMSVGEVVRVSSWGGCEGEWLGRL